MGGATNGEAGTIKGSSQPTNVIFTSQGLVLLLLTNALTGDMEIKRSDQPPKEVVRKVAFKMQPLLYS